MNPKKFEKITHSCECGREHNLRFWWRWHQPLLEFLIYHRLESCHKPPTNMPPTNMPQSSINNPLNPSGVELVNYLGESQSRLYPHMRANFGRGPMVVSKKGSLKLSRWAANCRHAEQFHNLSHQVSCTLHWCIHIKQMLPSNPCSHLSWYIIRLLID